VLSTITVANGDPLGTDITAIRFTPGSGTNGTGGVFREIDVIGTADDTPVLLGDVNLSGDVTFSDISPFIALLASGAFQLEADIDGSGDVGFSDISPFISILSAS